MTCQEHVNGFEQVTYQTGAEQTCRHTPQGLTRLLQWLLLLHLP